MGLLSWLFGGTNPRTVEIQDNLAIDDFGFYEIPSIGFRGQGVSSRNERFHFAWQEGRIILVGDGRLCWQHRLERPGDGSLAENGCVSVIDWLSRSEVEDELGLGRMAIFYVFSAEGAQLLKLHLSASYLKGGISEDGMGAWCSGEHNVMILDVPQARGIADLYCGGFIPDRVAFSPSGFAVTTTAKIVFEFSRSGKLINEVDVKRQTEAFHWASDKPWGLLSIAEERAALMPPAQMNEAQFGELIGLLAEASNRLQGYENRQAQTERQLGELKLARGGKFEALTHFKKALALNPKVGVKKLVAQLEKEL